MDLLYFINPLIEIIVITVIYNYFLSFFWNTKSMDLILGLIAFLLIFALSSLLPFAVLHKLMLLVANVAVIALIVIFQPELRIALSKLSFQGNKIPEISSLSTFIEQVVAVTYRLADKNLGAIIIIQRNNSLEDVISSGHTIDARFSPELIESIFLRKGPVHDGAVVIANGRLRACNVILPLASSSSNSFGTRHLAGLGISSKTDAIAIVVSEERAHVSLAIDGYLLRNIQRDRFIKIISGYFNDETIKKNSIKNKYLNKWFKS